MYVSYIVIELLGWHRWFLPLATHANPSRLSWEAEEDQKKG